MKIPLSDILFAIAVIWFLWIVGGVIFSPDYEEYLEYIFREWGYDG